MKIRLDKTYEISGAGLACLLITNNESERRKIIDELQLKEINKSEVEQNEV